MATEPSDAALIVFARLPVPGAVKTRLQPVIGPEACARLYEAFLRDALDQYAALGPAVRLYLAPAPEPVPPGLVPDGADVFTQQGADLGARMLRAFVETFGAGYARAVVVGTDHPTLPDAFVEIAFEALDEPLSVCIGPSDDGGYYLLGMNELYPQLFAGMTYSRPDVFDATVARAAQTSAGLTVLPPWYDVDTPADLRRLLADLDETPPHTRRVLQELAGAHPELRSSHGPER